MNYRRYMILLLLFIVPLIYAADEVKAVIKAKQFYKAADPVVLDGSESVYPANKKKKVQFVWSVKDQDGVEYAPRAEEPAVTLSLKEGAYTATLQMKLGRASATATREFVVAEKESVSVTFKIIPPKNTPDTDYIFLGHEIAEQKEWVPYATMMTKKEDGAWYATLTLKTGKMFKFQPTRGSWANKARNATDGDYIINYVPYKDDLIEISDFSWGKFVDDPKLHRDPLLVFNSEDFTRMKLLWNTGVHDLYYGEAGTPGKKAEVTEYEYGQEGFLNGLLPGKTYFYQVGSDGTKYEFKTPDNDGKFVFTACADGQNLKSVIEASARKMASYNPAFILYAGDMGNSGLKVSSWDMTFFKPFVPAVMGIPVAFAPGNHEEGSPLFNRYTGQKYNWMTFVNENTRFLLIDVEGTYVPGSVQYAFIENTLKNNKSKWLVVVMHESPYAFVPRHYSNLLARETLAPLFEKYGVNLVLAGHNHAYERVRPVKGVTYVTLPCLGSNKPEDPKSDVDPFSAVQVFGKDGFAVVNVDNSKIAVRIETPTGETIDTFTITK